MRMKKWKKITAGALSVCMLATCAPSLAELGGILQPPVTVHAKTSDIIVTGNCGKEAKWNYNRNTKVLTITGAGTVTPHCIDRYRTEVKQLIFSDGITQIAISSFEDFTALEDIQFGGVKKIDDLAFTGCTSLKSLNLDGNLKEIGVEAFRDCKNLTTVTVGSKLETVYWDIFKGCDNLTSITVSKDNTYVYAEGKKLFNYKISGSCGKKAKFSYDGKTKTMTLSGSGAMQDGGSYVGDYDDVNPWEAYSNFLTKNPYGKIITQEMEHLVVGDKITHIGNYAFADCKSLKSVKLGKNVTTIGNYAFSQCSKLNEISSLANLTKIGNHSFYACKKLKTFSIGKSVKSIGKGTFCECANLTKLSVHKSNKYFSKRGNMLLNKSQSKIISANFGANKTCNIYSSVKSVDEALIGDSSVKYFSVNKNNSKYSSKNGLLYSKNGKTLKKCPAKMSGSVDIDDTVTSIDKNAFCDCNNITQINIGKNVKSMDYVFRDTYMKKINNIQISSENNYYYEANGSIIAKNDDKLLACYKIDGDTYTLPDSVQKIGAYAFRNQKQLKKVILPNSVELSNYAFRIHEDVTSYTYLLSIESIHFGENYNNPTKNFEFFSELETLKEITVSSENPNYTSIDGILYDKDVKEILCFPNAIESYTIPESVTSKSDSTSLDHLKNLTLSDTITDATNWVSYNLESLHIGKNVGILKDNFSSNMKYISVNEENSTFKTVNNMLYSKDGSTFILCPAQTEGKVVLENGVTEIKECAFANCTKITDIVIPDTVSKIDDNAFGDGYGKMDSIVIWVPKCKKDYYKSLFIKKTGFTSNMVIMELEN